MNDNANNETCPFEEIMKFLNKDKPNNETISVEDKPEDTNFRELEVLLTTSDNKNYCPEMAINLANGVDYYKGKAEAYKEVIDSLITLSFSKLFDGDCE